METISGRDEAWAASSEIRDAFEAHKDRKTIRVDPIRRTLAARINQLNLMASQERFVNRDFAKARELLRRNEELVSLLHTFNCYGGYNSRMWRAFTHHGEKWHEIVTKLHEIDDTVQGKTGHYWKLLRLLDWPFEGTGRQYQPSPSVFYSGRHTTDREPTVAEVARALRIHDAYAQVLGLS
jgi:hypothetical protein